ncbi:hypothetical protein BY458DRAFT_10527 [Sporodiniella umbellata]|nr:hypothetical protein BY458DRAFT_10527 [Sporodiniella umbellata]
MNISDSNYNGYKPNSPSPSLMSVEEDLFAEPKRRRFNNSSANSTESSPCPSSTSSVIDLPFVIDLTQDSPTQSMQELTISEKKPSRQAMFLEQMRRRQELKDKQKREMVQKELERERVAEEFRKGLIQKQMDFDKNRQQTEKSSEEKCAQIRQTEKNSVPITEHVQISKERPTSTLPSEQKKVTSKEKSKPLSEEHKQATASHPKKNTSTRQAKNISSHFRKTRKYLRNQGQFILCF